MNSIGQVSIVAHRQLMRYVQRLACLPEFAVVRVMLNLEPASRPAAMNSGVFMLSGSCRSE